MKCFFSGIGSRKKLMLFHVLSQVEKKGVVLFCFFCVWNYGSPVGQVRFFLLWCKFFLLLFIFFFSCMKKMLSQEYSFSVLNRMKNKHFHDFFLCVKLQKELLYQEIYFLISICVYQSRKNCGREKKKFFLILIVPQGLRKKCFSREFFNFFFFFDTLKFLFFYFLTFPSGLQYFINMTFNLINIC